MTGTYAMGGPWMRFGGHRGGPCGDAAPELQHLQDWFARMTGRRTGHGPRHGAAWGMFGAPAPFAPPWAGGGRGWRGPKARRGDVRAAILAVLAEQPMNGYQIIQEIAARSDGAWKPSPGSIYPTLQQLEDEGLVRAETDGGRRQFTLTDQGRSYVTEHADEVSAPWAAMSEAASDDELKPLIGQVAAAMWQIMAVGTPDQQAQAREAVTSLRRTLYGILAEDDDDQRAGGPS